MCEAFLHQLQLQIAKRGSGDPRYSRLPPQRAQPARWGPRLGSQRCEALYSQRRMMSVALMPPKPKELERPMSNLCAMALFGT